MDYYVYRVNFMDLLEYQEVGVVVVVVSQVLKNF
jgi:hypothetical protein